MSRRGIYAMAGVWTLLMAAAIQFGLLATPAAIVLMTGYVWFVLGRLSCRPVPEANSEAAETPRWGRAGGRAQ